MKSWSWVEPGDNDEPVVQTITEEEILRTYYPMWAGCLYGLGRANLISAKNCIEDFVTVHWAQEVK